MVRARSGTTSPNQAPKEIRPKVEPDQAQVLWVGSPQAPEANQACVANKDVSLWLV